MYTIGERGVRCVRLKWEREGGREVCGQLVNGGVPEELPSQNKSYTHLSEQYYRLL